MYFFLGFLTGSAALWFFHRRRTNEMRRALEAYRWQEGVTKRAYAEQINTLRERELKTQGELIEALKENERLRVAVLNCGPRAVRSTDNRMAANG